jgi:hypothetical protein
MHATEHNELGVRARCGLTGEFERVTRDIGKLNDLVTLVVVTEYE